ncbi:MAG: heavy metal translocating P-type ATPase [Acholeplasmatales bacterium]|nr:MAG: heavy metal translocating P-type ATPase [Acholeplasmatales bacterium]
MIKKALRVEGMTCTMCAKTIENTFESVEGASVKVNVGAGKVLLSYDENRYKLTDMAALIQAAGYKPVLEASLEDNAKERKRLRQRVILALVLSFPLLWAMFGHLDWFAFLYVPSLFMDGLFQLIVAGIVQFYIGARFYKSAYKSLRKKVLGMDILVVLGTSSAYFYSLYLFLEHRLSGGMGMHGPELYFEISAVIITMVLVGNYFEHVAKERTTDALVELINLGAKEARKVFDDGARMVPIDDVFVGDKIVVLASEKFPVDGKIVQGSTHSDESMITGESIPVGKKAGDTVIGATLNVGEKVVIEATKVGSDTMLSQIIATVEEASSQKLPIQRTADTVAAYFVPGVMAIALLNFLLHMVVLDGFTFAEAFTRSIAILVISCPCALGLATPTSILVGNGKAAQNHILYKGGEFFERANAIDAIAFDKTGTLTAGKPTLTDWLGDESVLTLVHAVEKESTHPISKALIVYAESRMDTASEATDFKVFQGKGIAAMVKGQRVLIGTAALMEDEGLDTRDFDAAHATLVEAAKTTNFVAVDNQVRAVYAVRDELKPTSKAVIRAMRARGIATYMVTGDNKTVAAAIAKEAGIDDVFAGVLPHEKAGIVESLQKKGHVTAFVGDGINDAPALKLADVGIAMGHGTDIAIDSSDVTLMSHDLGLVIKAIDMSKATLRNIRQNFFWAFSYNLVAIPLAASGRLSMVLAAAAMGFSSIAVVLNALRLKAFKLPEFESEIKEETKMEFKVEDMTCGHCKMRIEKALAALGAKHVTIDLDNKLVRVEDTLDEAVVKEAIVQAGYTVS